MLNAMGMPMAFFYAIFSKKSIIIIKGSEL